MNKSAIFGFLLTVTYLQIYTLIHYLTVTLLNTLIELSINLDLEPLKSVNAKLRW